MKALTSKVGDLLSHFDIIDESQSQIQNTSPKHLFINNHNAAANKSNIKGQLHLEHVFVFCKTFKKITKHSIFPLTLKTADLQDIIYTTLGNKAKINFDKVFYYVSMIIPNAEAQIMFNDSFKNGFTLSFDSRTCERKTVDTQLEILVDIGSAQNNTSPKCLIVADQTAARIGVPNKANKIAVLIIWILENVMLILMDFAIYEMV